MNLKEIALKYFKTFSNQDVPGLAEMFHQDVYLRDWEQTFTGKEAVVKANSDIFDSVKTINVEPLNLALNDNHVIAEINVVINDGEETLKVVDSLEFANDGLIKAVRAYKG